MIQTKVSDTNRQDFYKSVYKQQSKSREQLIDLTQFDNCIVVDSCGAYYKTIFQKTVIVLETFSSAKEYKFTRDQFDKLIDNQNNSYINWPSVNTVNPVLIFDHSPLLKYKSISELCQLLSDAAEKYQAIKIVIKHKLSFIDDSRLTDRFYNFQDFRIQNYCFEKFNYDTASNEYFIQLKRITTIE